MPKKNSPGCGCCGICQAHNPNAIQQFTEDFSGDLSQWSPIVGASIHDGKLLLTRPVPGSVSSVASASMLARIGCNQNNFRLDVSVEFHGVLDPLTDLPQAYCQIRGAGLAVMNRYVPSGGPVTFPNPGKYFVSDQNGVYGPAQPDTPAPGDIIQFSIIQNGAQWNWATSINGTKRRTGVFSPAPSPATTCNLFIRFVENANIPQPGGPTYLFDNVIATATCG